MVHGIEQQRFNFSVLLARWWPVVVLGLTTIGAYGMVFYAYGVFIVPIRAETGWSASGLSAAFSISLLVSGLGALLTGRLLDQVGGRTVLLGAGLGGATLLFVSASTKLEPVFIITWGLGGGLIGAGLFYNITMAITTRLYSEKDRTRAFAALTFIGGFASPIFFPLTGLIIDKWGWRHGLRIEVGLLLLCVLPAILLITNRKTRGAPQNPEDKGTGFSGIREAFRNPVVMRMIAAFSLSLGAVSAVQMHHVPAMEFAGLSLATATAIAGIRGLLALPGRAMLSPIVNLLGVRGSIQVMYGATAAGLLAFFLAGPFFLILVFAVLTGLTFGLIIPLHGLYTAQIFGEERIGTLMGAQTVIVSLVAALCPFILGMTIDLTGSYGVLLMTCTLITLIAIWLLAPKRSFQGNNQD